VWYPFEVGFVENSSRTIESDFGLAEAFVKFDVHEDQRDLDPLGVPVIAVRRSGYVRVIDVLLSKVLRLSRKRSFGPHGARKRPNRYKSHENSRKDG